YYCGKNPSGGDVVVVVSGVESLGQGVL
nr:anti-SIV gp148 Ig heavy chain {CDR3 heavy chain region} [Macaca fascicularis=cynomolgus monkey, Peptide Partial, 27 aa] [Macaca fascicularis]